MMRDRSQTKCASMVTVKVPEISTPLYQEAIRQALVDRVEENSKVSRYMLRNHSLRWERKILASGIGLSLALVLTVGGVLGLSRDETVRTEQVHAQELIDEAQMLVDQMDQWKRHVIEAQLSGDVDSILAEARAAEDLVRLDGDYFPGGEGVESESGQMANPTTVALATARVSAETPISLTPRNNDSWASLAGLSLVRYTDAQGRRVLLGFNSEGIPTIRLTSEGYYPQLSRRGNVPVRVVVE